MRKIQPRNDSIEAMGEAYELLLANVLRKKHQGGAALHSAIDEVRDAIVGLHKFGDDEIVKLEAYVKRDLIDAARYMDKSGKELKDWVGFDTALLSHKFWTLFSEAADHTTTTLNQFKQQAEYAEYQAGELTGIGTLLCDQCGEKLHFHKPGHIPPCPRCNSTHYHRQHGIGSGAD